VISTRTKVLPCGVAPPIIVLIVIAVWLALVPYYDRLVRRSSRFAMFSFHIHLLPWFCVCITILAVGLTSFLYDRRASRKR
jgi:hypothetical protein